jgi:hypothetical protein
VTLDNKNEHGDRRYLARGRYCKIYKILQNKMVWTCRKVAKNQRMPKQIAEATIEGTRKRGRPRRRWKEEVEEDLNIMEIKNRRASARDRRNWRKIVL